MGRTAEIDYTYSTKFRQFSSHFSLIGSPFNDEMVLNLGEKVNLKISSPAAEILVCSV